LDCGDNQKPLTTPVPCPLPSLFVMNAHKIKRSMELSISLIDRAILFIDRYPLIFAQLARRYYL
jgi:hypothetical protein